VNTGASWPTLSVEEAQARVLGIQTKLHRWATDDRSRRFDDLFNLVCDPAFLLVGWRRVRGNKGARSAGVDGQTAYHVERERGEAVFLAELRAELKARTFAPLPVRERMIPKPGGKQRRLGIATVRDRVVQAALKLVLEPILEADFQPCSYGFRPGRRAQDAIAEIHLFTSHAYQWVLEADITACFDEISHAGITSRLRRRIGDRRVLALVKAFLKAGILSQDGAVRDTITGTPQGGILTPPTQQITRGGFGACDRDAVVDDHSVGTNEHLLDQQPQHPLALGDRGGRGGMAQPAEEALQVLGELEGGLLVDQLRLERVELGGQGVLFGAQGGHAAAQLVQAEQLFLVGLNESADGGGGAGLLAVQAGLGGGGGVGGAQLGQAPVELAADQGGVGQQPGHVLPDDLVEVVGPHRQVGAHPPAGVAVVVGAQAP
jgi:retron-type reverse transcriptase